MSSCSHFTLRLKLLLIFNRRSTYKLTAHWNCTEWRRQGLRKTSFQCHGIGIRCDGTTVMKQLFIHVWVTLPVYWQCLVAHHHHNHYLKAYLFGLCKRRAAGWQFSWWAKKTYSEWQMATVLVDHVTSSKMRQRLRNHFALWRARSCDQGWGCDYRCVHRDTRSNTAYWDRRRAMIRFVWCSTRNVYRLRAEQLNRTVTPHRYCVQSLSVEVVSIFG